MECTSESLGAFLVSWCSSKGIWPLQIGAASTKMYIESSRKQRQSGTFVNEVCKFVSLQPKGFVSPQPKGSKSSIKCISASLAIKLNLKSERVADWCGQGKINYFCEGCGLSTFSHGSINAGTVIYTVIAVHICSTFRTVV
jgi:hypothetical protein